MISKELLSKVLGWKDIHIVHTKLDMVVADTEENFSDPDWDEDWEYGINIHELAHKCKEWALKQENCFAIVSGKLPSNYFCCLQYRFQWLGTSDFEEYFRADTEPEAIFKACEWILEQRKVEL